MRNSRTLKLITSLSSPLSVGLVFAILLLIRNAWLYWSYSYAFYPDSNLYVHLGASFFDTGYISPLVTFPYPLLNAITGSSHNPGPLIWFQLIFSAVVGGFVVWVLARKDRLLGALIGGLLLFDLVWGALARSILTDGMFATLNLLAVGILVFHYDRRDRLAAWELFFSGILYALAISIRPSNIFLVVLFPPLYLWLTRSWKKMIYLSTGLLIFFIIMGTINLVGNQKFYILSDNGSYTSDYLAFPLIVNNLFSPENGLASKQVDKYLQTCYPGMVYANEVERSVSGDTNNSNNTNLIYQKIIPCIQSQSELHHNQENLFRNAYLEALQAHPIKFAQSVFREVAIFIRYANPYVLRWQLNPTNNYGCVDLQYCNELNAVQSEWDHQYIAIRVYEKLATKILQIYLTPIGLLSWILPDKQYSPYLVSWVFFILLAIFCSRGRERILALVTSVIIVYTVVIVVVGLRFAERYASMLTPMQTVFSGVVWMLIFRAGWAGWNHLKQQVCKARSSKRIVG